MQKRKKLFPSRKIMMLMMRNLIAKRRRDKKMYKYRERHKQQRRFHNN